MSASPGVVQVRYGSFVGAPCSIATEPASVNDRELAVVRSRRVASATEQFSTTRPGPCGLA
jgi:hypothetical protein